MRTMNQNVVRTRSQELEYQVKDIFKEFYKEKLVEAQVTSFILDADEINGMLSVEVVEKDSGKFYSKEVEDEIYYKFVKCGEDHMLAFLKIGDFTKGCDLP